MNWWQETEARAHRTRTPAALAQTLSQRMNAAGVAPELSAGPAYDLAWLHALCTDLVQLTEGFLLCADGDRPSLRRQAVTLSRWVDHALHWTRSSAAGFNHLVDSLELTAEKVAGHRELMTEAVSVVAAPAEQAKLDGRYHHWHLLYERLDLKLAAGQVTEAYRQVLARSLAVMYEHALVTLRMIRALERETDPRVRQVSNTLLEINTTWHFDLGPRYLAPGELWAGSSRPGLQTLLLLSFGENEAP